ncbi:MAG TPA: FadD3 family acyl-CoA ligase [Actinomycetota bacterium]|nr:FadD3 family acyl-CoA ligase [Actinomycetota bacterium]
MTEWRTIPDLVRSAADRFGSAEAIVDGEVRLSFSGLAAAVDQSARATMAAGVQRGDRVAIWAPNCWEWVVAALGVHGAGGVLVPINTRFKGREAGYILERSGARLLFTVSGFLDIDYVRLLKDEGVDVARIVTLRGPGASWNDYLLGSDQVSMAELNARQRTIEPDDLGDVMFTSGTTGKPKGVMTTHTQTLRVFETWSRLVGLAEGDRYLIANPFFHTFGYKAGFIACLMRGATIIPHAVFDVSSVLKRISEEEVSMLPGPPTLYQSILNEPERGDLSSLRLAVTGAAPVPVELINRMRTELTFKTILTAYGLTESTGVVTMCREDDDAETISSSSGRAIPDVEVRIVDDGNHEVARGEPGEIVVRGYNVMRGYYEDPEATAEAIDADGWLHTGDIGVMDDRGYVRITDRKKDMFIVGGFNAYPAEIENELLAHPSVAQVAVVGIPDERMGEVGCAFVVPRAGAAVDSDELMAWAKERMANYKVPRRVEVLEALPLNASGKVLKYELRDRMTT